MKKAELEEKLEEYKQSLQSINHELYDMLEGINYQLITNKMYDRIKDDEVELSKKSRMVLLDQKSDVEAIRRRILNVLWGI